MAFTRSTDRNVQTFATLDEWRDLGYAPIPGAQPRDVKDTPHYFESMVVKIDGSEDHLIQDGRVVQ